MAANAVKTRAVGQVRPCLEGERQVALDIINAAAKRYQGVIPDDCWHEPYMSAESLARDLAEGVELWAYERDDQILGVMGLQLIKDVALIRHAYVRPDAQGAGVGGALLRHLERLPPRPMLIGTWAAADWAIGFYRRHGFAPVEPIRAARLLETYWTVSARQREVSIVLARAS